MRTTLIFSILLTCQALFAQSNAFFQTIKGTVVDQDTEYPIIGATVALKIEDKIVGAQTDIDGRFIIENVPVGRHTLEFSYLGYEKRVIPNILVQSAKESILNVKMEEKINDLDEIVVTADKDKHKAINEMAAISARTLSIDETVRFSGSFQDPARMAQNFAGVSGASDDRNDIIVRGNSPTGVLWRMEGVDIPSPNHWSTFGSTGGPISMINANNLQDSDFISSAFPAEYGNATAAVFDLKLRNGNTDKYEFLGQIGFNGFEFGAEGPLKLTKNSSFMANYRYSTLGVFDALGLDFGTGGAVPQYQDLTFKLNIPNGTKGKFNLWGFGGNSEISFLANQEDNLYVPGSQNFYSQAETGVIGASYLHFFDNNTYTKLSLVVSGTESRNFADETADSTDLFERVFTSINSQVKYTANWTFNKKINSKNKIKAGVVYDYFDLAMNNDFLISEGVWFKEVDFTGDISLVRAFAQMQHKFSEKLKMNLGLHGALLNLNNSKSLEPRFSLSYQANPKNTFSLGAGMHSQMQPLPIYFSKKANATEEENLANENLDFIRSQHYVTAWDRLLGNNMRLKVEAYYQNLGNLAVDADSSAFSLINTGADFGFPNRVGLVNEGTGTNAGVEITFEKFFSEGYYFLVTGSFFDSKYKGSDEIERNTFFNSNYVGNLLGGKEFKFSEKFTLTTDFKVTYAGGRRYTPIDLEQSIVQGQQVRDQSQYLEGQYAPYFRTDFKIGFRHNAKKYTQTFSVDLQNVTNKQNVFRQSYSASQEAISTEYQRGFFPDVRYQILF